MKIKGVLLQAGKTKKEDKPHAVEFDIDNLEEIRTLLDCDTIDIVQREIGLNRYCVICDDEGRLKENPIVSALSFPDCKVAFVGNLLVCGLPEGDQLTGLNDNQIKDVLVSVVGMPEWTLLIGE